MRKRTSSLPSSLTPSTTSGTSQEGSGTAGSAGRPPRPRYYAYSVAGPAPQGRFAWHCFDPDKILLDPYAKSVFFPPPFDRAAAAHPGSNAGKAPLGLLAAPARCSTGAGRRPRHQSDAIIYELHVRGFTKNPNSGVRPERRGTFAGLVEKIPYLKDLGVTAVELMPIFQFDPQEGNYWGYMPLSFFAPHHAYGSRPEDCDQHNAFRAWSRRSTPRTSRSSSTWSTTTRRRRPARAGLQLQGNRQQHLLPAVRQARKPLRELLGHREHPALHQPLRAQDDRRQPALLGPGNARRWLSVRPGLGLRPQRRRFAQPEGPADLRRHPLDPDLADIRLIAEPWDAAGAYQLGRSFPATRWFQWNGRFRDDVRRFMRGDPGLVPALMQRLYGSDDLFPDDRMHAFHPYQSVNYVTSHDGFTLYDLVSYDRKHNQANGHDNTTAQKKTIAGTAGRRATTNPGQVLQLRRASGQELLLPLAPGERHAHVPRRRRDPANPGRQQQPVQSGQRDQLARLGPAPLKQDVFRFFRA